MLRLMNDHVLVDRLRPMNWSSSIIERPDDHNITPEVLYYGRIMATGDGRVSRDGEPIPGVRNMAKPGIECIFVARFKELEGREIPGYAELELEGTPVIVAGWDILAFVYTEAQFIKPGYGYVLTRPDSFGGEHKMPSGLVIVREDREARDAPWNTAVVLRAAPWLVEKTTADVNTGVKHHSDLRAVVEVPLEPHDRIIFRRYAAWQFDMFGETLGICNLKDVQTRVGHDVEVMV